MDIKDTYIPEVRRFDEATARGLINSHKSGKPTACPYCEGVLSFKQSTDETRAENWYINCWELKRCAAFGDVIGFD